MATLQVTTSELQQQGQILVQGVNVEWISTCTYMIFLMRTGFALREAGNTRLKNLQAILFKNVLDICFISIMWWFTGYAFAYGRDKGMFLGVSSFATQYFDYSFDAYNYVNWVYQWALSTVASAIVLGPVSERITLWGILLYNMLFIGWVYPIIVHWCWAGGWLQDLGYFDQAGGGVVLMTGGFAGLIASIIVGPRIDRFSPAHVADFRPNNVPFSILGSLLIWVAFYSFNTVSTYGIVGFNSTRVPLAALNTVLASATGGIMAAMTHYIFNKNTTYRYSNHYLIGGVLSAIAAISTGCASVSPWAAFLYGIIAGPFYVGFAKMLSMAKVDDPVDSVAIFAGGGMLGLLLTPFFETTYGIFYGGANILGINILAIVTIFGWVAIHTIVFMYILKAARLLREDPQVELMGQDQAYFGGLPYSYDVTTYKAAQVRLASDQGVSYRGPEGVELYKQNAKISQVNPTLANGRSDEQDPIGYRSNMLNSNQQVAY